MTVLIRFFNTFRIKDDKNDKRAEKDEERSTQTNNNGTGTGSGRNGSGNRGKEIHQEGERSQGNSERTSSEANGRAKRGKEWLVDNKISIDRVRLRIFYDNKWRPLTTAICCHIKNLHTLLDKP